MTVRSWVIFNSDLPYDAIEDETGFIQWPGKNVAEAIAEILGGCGYTNISIDVLEHAGYEIAFNIGKIPFGARVTVIDTYTVNIRQYSWLDELFGRQRPEYLEALERLNAELAKDGRFHDIRWFTDDEVLTGVEGSLSPLAEPLHQPRPFDETGKRTPGTVRSWVEFTTDLPDDGIPAKEGSGFFQIPGKGVTQEISKMLARCGCKKIRTSYRHNLGWELHFLAGKRRLAARINLIDKYRVRFWQESRGAKTVELERPEYVEVLRRLNTELAKDSRFHDMRWFSEREIHAGLGGALTPAED